VEEIGNGTCRVWEVDFPEARLVQSVAAWHGVRVEVASVHLEERVALWRLLSQHLQPAALNAPFLSVQPAEHRAPCVFPPLHGRASLASQFGVSFALLGAQGQTPDLRRSLPRCQAPSLSWPFPLFWQLGLHGYQKV